jgi:hypothetical protein
MSTINHREEKTTTVTWLAARQHCPVIVTSHLQLANDIKS